MQNVAAVRFKMAGKLYYFDPNGIDLRAGDSVIVETVRGVEFGSVAYDIKQVDESEIVAPLKPVIRKATLADCEKQADNELRTEKAKTVCLEKIARHKLDMKLVDVEYTFDNSKLIFYFTADERVDFRELVKDLASVFKTRIELRQIGVRDEMKLMGGIGNCGRELCCGCWMGDFQPVSIKMAKVQNLSLNPIKISGTCGRLMCCLQFENDTYAELKKGMPDTGEKVTTVDGTALVVDVNILENKIKTRLVLEEKTEDKPEKLSSEYYIYTKEEITRVKKKHPQNQPKPEGSKKSKKSRKKHKASPADDVEISGMTEEELLAMEAEAEAESEE